MPRLKTEQREQAIRRGVDFIYTIAGNRKTFRSYGPYLLCFFRQMALTSLNEGLRRMAREMGGNLAARWRSARKMLPARANPETICEFVIAGCAAEHFGLQDRALKDEIRRAARCFSIQEFLGFDPTAEPPPENLTERCHCGLQNPRGRKTCQKCKRRLKMTSRYHTWMEALCATYWFERYGVSLEARYSDVLKWLPKMRPYFGLKRSDYLDFFYTAYAVTHVVYTLNGYGVYNLSRRWLPNEFAFLKANLKEAISLEDSDMVAEFVDSLKSFGLSDDHPTIRRGMNYLLSEQNPDGSWGDADDGGTFRLFHATWTAIDALRDYAWRGEGLSLPNLKPLIDKQAGTRR
jgi:hypothetical protein